MAAARLRRREDLFRLALQIHSSAQIETVCQLLMSAHRRCRLAMTPLAAWFHLLHFCRKAANRSSAAHPFRAKLLAKRPPPTPSSPLFSRGYEAKTRERERGERAREQESEIGL